MLDDLVFDRLCVFITLFFFPQMLKFFKIDFVKTVIRGRLKSLLLFVFYLLNIRHLEAVRIYKYIPSACNDLELKKGRSEF